jgi:hypothetical protein
MIMAAKGHVGGEPCKFVDLPIRVLSLYGGLYGPYNLPHKFKNLAGDKFERFPTYMVLESGPIHQRF